MYRLFRKIHLVDERRPVRKERYNIKDAISEVKRSATKRKKDNKLNDSEIEDLILQKCYYCGEMNDSGRNSIDRLNNDLGYTHDNTVSSCTICNMMKNKYTEKLFYKYCENISKNFGCKELQEYIDLELMKYRYKRHIYSTTSRNKKRAKRNDVILNFDLTFKEYREIAKYKCYYCGNLNNNNEKECVGLDRIDNNKGYDKENIVPSCYICNIMKLKSDITEFIDKINKILKYRETKKEVEEKIEHVEKEENKESNTILSDKFIIKKVPKIITKDWLIDKIEEYSKHMNVGKIVDHRDIRTFLHDDIYYKKLIYNTHDIDKFEAELEFCESNEQHDIWMYFRLKISSFEFQKSVGRQIYILIRDNSTKKYVGIASLSSDLLYCEARDTYIGWTDKDKHENKRLNNIMNISTCVGIPPFSFNYNGGKLIAMLMFSKEVYKYVKDKYSDKLVGLNTFSLYGKSIQYDRIKNLKFIGYTKGNGSFHIPKQLYKSCTKYMDHNNIEYKKYKRRMYIMRVLIQNLGIKTDITHHGIERGVYFGYTCNNGNEYLTSKVDKCKRNCESVDEICTYWKDRWAKQRYVHLIKNNRLMLSDEHEDKNILSNKEYKKIQKRESRKNDERVYNKMSNEELNEILKIKKLAPNMSLRNIVAKMKDTFEKDYHQESIRRVLNKYKENV